MVYPVLITTSGTGSRLYNLTKNTNKSLVKLGDKYAICYIIEQYEPTTEFIITIGHYGKYVKDFLLIAYPKYNFTFIEIDMYQGEGSSLGYSLLQTRNHLNRPFIFHCCDAIIKSRLNTDFSTNTLIVSKYSDSKQYTNILSSGDTIIELNNKGHCIFDFVYTGISFIKDYESFWNNLDIEYTKNPNNKSLSDVNSIQKMLQQNILFKYKEVTDWYDTGNLESYNKACEQFKSNYNVLEKDYESICFFDDKVIKFINDPTINNKRYLRGKQLCPFTPEILNYSDNFIVMQKIDGQLLSQYYSHGEIYKLLIWAHKYLWTQTDVNSKYINCSYNFYIKKTLSRLESLDLINEINTINGLHTSSILSLINGIDSSILTTEIFSKFHGDFILDNILKTENGYCLLDWRHEFDNQLTYGDSYYDLAKLRHNIIFNHDNIRDNLYTIEIISDTATVDLKCNYFLMNQLQDFDKFVQENGYNLHKIKLLTSIIWLNMAPLYGGKLRDFLFYFGKFNLHLLLN